MSEQVITPRWTPLRPHPVQIAWMRSTARFNVVPAGRRSGKTERAKRKLVIRALEETNWPDAKFFAAAPTRDQAKRIYWEDLKRLIPPTLLLRPPKETELTIDLVNGASISVIGMDKPERIEGSPWNGGILDEFANMKKQAWSLNVLPALADRMGWCDLIGVPEGRNHYYDLYQKALSDSTGQFKAFHWVSADILPSETIEMYRSSMDELSFQQEFEASFLNFQGRIYYVFDRNTHCSRQVTYNKNAPLIFCFDFNVEPGVAAVLQEHPKLPCGNPGTAIIGQVYIPRNSTTPAVCRRLAQDWSHHQGIIYCYGDATGGASGTAKIAGSDWDLIRKELRVAFGDRVRMMVPDSNPPERARVNAMNSRMKTATGEIQMMVNPELAPAVVNDLEGVRCLEGGSGEIDKNATPELTHISDAIGYYIHYKFPVSKPVAQRNF